MSPSSPAAAGAHDDAPGRAFHGRAGFLIEPPVIVEDEGAIVDTRMCGSSSGSDPAGGNTFGSGFGIRAMETRCVTDGSPPPPRGSRCIRTTNRRRRQAAERSQSCGALRHRRPSAQRMLFDGTPGRGQQPRRRCRVGVRRPTASQPDLTTSHEPRPRSRACRPPQAARSVPGLARARTGARKLIRRAPWLSRQRSASQSGGQGISPCVRGSSARSARPRVRDTPTFPIPRQG